MGRGVLVGRQPSPDRGVFPRGGSETGAPPNFDSPKSAAVCITHPAATTPRRRSCGHLLRPSSAPRTPPRASRTGNLATSEWVSDAQRAGSCRNCVSRGAKFSRNRGGRPWLRSSPKLLRSLASRRSAPSPTRRGRTNSQGMWETTTNPTVAGPRVN